LHVENHERDRRQDFLFAIGLCLIVTVVLVLVGAVLSSGRFGGVSGRNRIELISGQGANIISSALLLGAVAALAFLTPERVARARPLVVAALIVGTAIALLAIFSIVDVLTVHVSNPGADSGVSFALLNGTSAADRIGTVLPEVGSLFIVLVALVGGNRLGGP
jgi:uncharacterized membrane protein YhaH (DUF805 family)